MGRTTSLGDRDRTVHRLGGQLVGGRTDQLMIWFDATIRLVPALSSSVGSVLGSVKVTVMVKFASVPGFPNVRPAEA